MCATGVRVREREGDGSRVVVGRRLCMRVLIRASELAAVAGRHPYKEQADAVREVMARCTQGKRKAEEVKAGAMLQHASLDSKVEGAKALGVDVSKVQAATKHAKTEEEKEEKVKDLLPSFHVEIVKAVDRHSLAVAKKEEAPTLSLPKEVAPVLEQHLRMAAGTVEEGSILKRAKETFPEEVGEGAVPGNALAWPPRLSLGRTSSGVEVQVTGMCDAMDVSRATVFEIKRRKARLFHSIPAYERVQLEAYLRLYGCLDGALLEYHPLEGMQIHWAEKDDHLWGEVEAEVMEAIESNKT